MTAEIFTFNIAHFEGRYWAHCIEDGNLGARSKTRSTLSGLVSIVIRRRYKMGVVCRIGNPKASRADCDFAYAFIPLDDIREWMARHKTEGA